MFEVVYNADDIVRAPAEMAAPAKGRDSAQTRVDAALLPGPGADIQTLRRFLEERFPGASARPAKTLSSGIPSIDEVLGGGLPLQALTEVLCQAPSAGGQLLIEGLLDSLRRECRYAVLIDGSDSFDPCSTPPRLLEHLLWVRCNEAQQALKAADALLRDENFPLVMLDLRWNERQQFRRIPGSTWYRLQRLCHAGSALVLFSRQSLAPSARLRIELQQPLSLESLEMERNQVLPHIHARIQRGQQLERVVSA